MSRSRNSSTIVILIVAAIAFYLDQLSKHWVVTHFMPEQSRIVIPRLLRWTYEENAHGAFGMFGSNPIVLVGMAIVVLIVFAFLFRDAASRSKLVRVAFGMILGGAIGNIADRFTHHFVVDFIDFYRIWPNIFNVADSCITCGVILLILSSLVRPQHRRS